MFCILSFGCFSFLPLIFVIIYLWSIQITGPVASPTVCCRLRTRGFSSMHCCAFCRSFKFPARSRDWIRPKSDPLVKTVGGNVFSHHITSGLHSFFLLVPIILSAQRSIHSPAVVQWCYSKSIVLFSYIRWKNSMRRRFPSAVPYLHSGTGRLEGLGRCLSPYSHFKIMRTSLTYSESAQLVSYPFYSNIT